MAHGQPDFGAYASKKTVASMADNAELAARLGSIVTFDRKGDIILLEDFQDNINKWWVSLSRAGASIGLSSKTARNGGLSCRIHTGNVAGDEEQLSRYLSFPVLSKIGFEAHFTLHEYLQSVTMVLVLDNGTNTFMAGLKYLPPTNVLQYFSAAAEWVDLTSGLALYPMRQCFHGFKLVVDFESKVYSRATVGQNSYPMTQAILKAATFLTPNTLGINILAATDTDASIDCHVADVIMTQNEP